MAFVTLGRCGTITHKFTLNCNIAWCQQVLSAATRRQKARGRYSERERFPGSSCCGRLLTSTQKCRPLEKWKYKSARRTDDGTLCDFSCLLSARHMFPSHKWQSHCRNISRSVQDTALLSWQESPLNSSRDEREEWAGLYTDASKTLGQSSRVLHNLTKKNLSSKHILGNDPFLHINWKITLNDRYEYLKWVIF